LPFVTIDHDKPKPTGTKFIFICNIVVQNSINQMAKKIILFASIFLAIAVILGALGAHSLKGKISAEHLESFKTGVTYQFYHALAMILLGILIEVFKKPALRTSAILFALGILFFSGSIYILSTGEITGIHAPILGPITPIGGLLFIAGWVITCIQFIKK
jgi:uncharacterized membrane protein YgdD (TMEM256/DUF423 family)